MTLIYNGNNIHYMAKANNCKIVQIDKASLNAIIITKMSQYISEIISKAGYSQKHLVFVLFISEYNTNSDLLTITLGNIRNEFELEYVNPTHLLYFKDYYVLVRIARGIDSKCVSEDLGLKPFQCSNKNKVLNILANPKTDGFCSYRQEQLFFQKNGIITDSIWSGEEVIIPPKYHIYNTLFIDSVNKIYSDSIRKSKNQ